MANTIAFPGRALGWTVRKGFVYGYRSIQVRRAAKRAIIRDGLHTADPDAPGVTIRTVEDPAGTISSTEGIWHTAGRDYHVPHLSAYASTGIGKNEHLLNPAAWNIIAHRPESGVINDVKGVSKRRTRARAGHVMGGRLLSGLAPPPGGLVARGPLRVRGTGLRGRPGPVPQARRGP